jgi:hypothetical protein
MKTFLTLFVFAAAIFGFTVSASADVAVLDWNNPGSATVFATEITMLNNDDHRNVTIDYAIQGDILYSRIQLDPSQYDRVYSQREIEIYDRIGYPDPSADFEFMTRLGLTNMRFFGGDERADTPSPLEGGRKNFMPDKSIWEAFQAAVNNGNGTITATFSSFTSPFDDDATTQKSTFFDSTRLDSSNYDLTQYYKNGINDMYYDTAGEGEFMEGPVPGFERVASATFAVDANGDIVYQNGAATDSFAFYGIPDNELDSIEELGLTTSYTYKYIDGWLQVFDGNDFLFMVSSDPTNGTIQYAVNLSSLGLENYSGIHIASEIEDYYTFLALPPTAAGTPEPATALILGFAGCIALPFLRRKKKIRSGL